MQAEYDFSSARENPYMRKEIYVVQYNREKMYRELEISEQQIKEGAVQDAKEALKTLKNKYAL